MSAVVGAGCRCVLVVASEHLLQTEQRLIMQSLKQENESLRSTVGVGAFAAEHLQYWVPASQLHMRVYMCEKDTVYVFMRKGIYTYILTYTSRLSSSSKHAASQ